jgi:hypothetical protein
MAETKSITKEQFDREMAELQLKRAQLENRRLEREIQTGELAEQNMKAAARRNGQTLAANVEAGARKMANCNHKKGGKGLEGFRGGGQDQHYAVIKHMFPNSDVGIFCLRCPKIWLPPVLPKRDDHNTEPEYKLAMQAYEKDLADYRWALMLPTDNEMSTSGLFRGGNFDQDCRDALHNAAANPQDV